MKKSITKAYAHCSYQDEDRLELEFMKVIWISSTDINGSRKHFNYIVVLPLDPRICSIQSFEMDVHTLQVFEGYWKLKNTSSWKFIRIPKGVRGLSKDQSRHSVQRLANNIET